MYLIAKIALSSETLPFTRLAARSDVSRIQFIPVLPVSQPLLPFFRLWGDDVDRAVEALRGDAAVDALTLLNERDGAGLVRVRWADGALGWLRAGVDQTAVTVLGAVVTSDGWRLRVGATAESELSAFQQHCRESMADTDLTEVRTSTTATRSETVTSAQQTALLLAVDRGYFAEPREVTLDDLGEELGISRQAFAGRLRRGVENLVQQTLKSPRSDEDSG